MMTALWHPDALPSLALGRHHSALRPLPGVATHSRRPGTTLDGGWTGSPTQSKATLNITGFFVAWDDNSFTSLKRNLGALGVLVSEWWRLEAGGTLSPESPGKNANMRAYVAVHCPGLPMMPLVNNYDPIMNCKGLVEA
ncbi:hypothetical protein [Deinococcus hopiensis]|uniref:Uncharacterized protein n=1 Tax=Deinococcus hopiensis KR-140 TaxID=695939 RepID=A0A1W1USU4_9DEIO|nr:hypothetical protein [Deinococcus hopiensis]SMB84123.1 hypothetical protein SAMN00790413_05004 [Deinococcus hopiensis KR-140]